MARSGCDALAGLVPGPAVVGMAWLQGTLTPPPIRGMFGPLMRLACCRLVMPMCCSQVGVG